MKINQKLFDRFPTKLDENQLAAFVKLVSQFNKKNDTLKVDQKQLEDLFNYGRDRTDNVLKFLVENKYITREQKRDEAGQFTLNEIRIVSDLVS